MNHVQWYVMARALQKKEQQEAEARVKLIESVYQAAIKSAREMFVHLTGTNIGAGKVEEGKPTPFIPLVPMLAHAMHDPQFIEELLKRQSDEKQTTEVLDDKGIDDLAEKLMQLEAGDLEPIFSGKNSEDPFERWMAPETQQAMKELGVELHQGDLEMTKDS